ncbi:hypothetical protein OTU49_000981, partial [Cherax quadricarinatus]
FSEGRGRMWSRCSTKPVAYKASKIFLKFIVIPVANYTSNYRLAEVGKFEPPKLTGKYETGQLFLHRVFGYRGVVLFPWLARVYDRDVPNKKESNKYFPDP